jgi:hypothetical protein
MVEFRRALARAPEFQRGLALMLQTHTFLFVGVRPDVLGGFLREIALDQPGSGQRHYMLLPPSGMQAIWETALARSGVAVLSYDDEVRGGFGDFIAALDRDQRKVARNRRPGDSATPLSALRVKRLALSNIGLFESLNLSFSTEMPKAPEMPETAEMPWTVIFGQNGWGKSTVLRAICAVLAGPEGEDASKRLLRMGADHGSIELEMEHPGEPGEPLLLRMQLDRDQSRVKVSSPSGSPVEAGVSLVLGFPSLRGGPSPNPTGPRPQAAVTAEVDDLLPLVRGTVDTRLGNFKQFLVNILVDSNQASNVRARRIRGLLDEIIREIIPGNVRGLVPIKGAPYEIRVRTSTGEVLFDDLSQGMASIFNWVGVLVQRLYDVYPDSISPPPEQQPAIAIVDELDAHLHPEWQRKLVSLTKAHFPKVQVIATSHSPLLAGNLRQCEIIAARLEPGSDPDRDVVTMRQIEEDVYGKSSQQILTGPTFRLSSDRNPETEKTINQYFELAAKREPNADEVTKRNELGKAIKSLDVAATGLNPVFEPPTADEAELVNKMLQDASEALGNMASGSGRST